MELYVHEFCFSSASRFLFLTHPLTVFIVRYCHCKKRMKTWYKTTPPFLYFKKSIEKLQVWELSGLCPETLLQLYVHEFGFRWRATWRQRCWSSWRKCAVSPCTVTSGSWRPSAAISCRTGTYTPTRFTGTSSPPNYSIVYSVNKRSWLLSVKGVLKKIPDSFRWFFTTTGFETPRALQRNLNLYVPRKGIALPQSQCPHSCERSIYSYVRPTYYSAAE